VTFEGTPRQLLKSDTLTGKYLSGRIKIDPSLRGAAATKQSKYLEIRGATHHNLKNINAKIPLGKFVCITGVSGSGKSTLINDILAKALLKSFTAPKTSQVSIKKFLGAENLNKVVLVDQSPIGRTPRSNPPLTRALFRI